MFVNLCNAPLQHLRFLKETKTNGRLAAKMETEKYACYTCYTYLYRASESTLMLKRPILIYTITIHTGRQRPVMGPHAPSLRTTHNPITPYEHPCTVQ